MSKKQICSLIISYLDCFFKSQKGKNTKSKCAIKLTCFSFYDFPGFSVFKNSVSAICPLSFSRKGAHKVWIDLQIFLLEEFLQGDAECVAEV